MKGLDKWIEQNGARFKPKAEPMHTQPQKPVPPTVARWFRGDLASTAAKGKVSSTFPEAAFSFYIDTFRLPLEGKGF